MWAQTWGALYDIAAPFPDAGDRPDATPEIEKVTHTSIEINKRLQTNNPLSSQNEKCSTMLMSFSNRLV